MGDSQRLGEGTLHGGSGARALGLCLLELVAGDVLAGIGADLIFKRRGEAAGLALVDLTVVVILDCVAERILDVVDLEDVLRRVGRNGQRRGVTVELVPVLRLRFISGDLRAELCLHRICRQLIVDHAVVVVLDRVIKAVLDVVDADDVVRRRRGDDKPFGQRALRRGGGSLTLGLRLLELVAVDVLAGIGADGIAERRGLALRLFRFDHAVVVVLDRVAERVLDVVNLDDVLRGIMADGEREILRFLELVAVDDLVGVSVDDILVRRGSGLGLRAVEVAVIVILDGVAEIVLDIVQLDIVVLVDSGDDERIGVRVKLRAVREEHFLQAVAVSRLFKERGDLRLKLRRCGGGLLVGLLDLVVEVLVNVRERILYIVDLDDVFSRIRADGGRLDLIELVAGLRLVGVGGNRLAVLGGQARLGGAVVFDVLIIILHAVGEGILIIVDVDDVLIEIGAVNGQRAAVALRAVEHVAAAERGIVQLRV